MAMIVPVMVMIMRVVIVRMRHDSLFMTPDASARNYLNCPFGLPAFTICWQ
jgi:hypothetical protein